MSKFGWCAGPVGAAVDHEACKYEIGEAGTILRCDCHCHERTD